MSAQFATMSRSLIAVYDGLAIEAMPTAEHRALLEQRRRAARKQLHLRAPLARLIPLGLIRSIKLAGISEDWYETPPAEIADAFEDLSTL
jgi:hypothetical protein